MTMRELTHNSCGSGDTNDVWHFVCNQGPNNSFKLMRMRKRGYSSCFPATFSSRHKTFLFFHLYYTVIEWKFNILLKLIESTSNSKSDTINFTLVVRVDKVYWYVSVFNWTSVISYIGVFFIRLRLGECSSSVVKHFIINGLADSRVECKHVYSRYPLWPLTKLVIIIANCSSVTEHHNHNRQHIRIINDYHS